ncbi:MAG: hypothetical protein LBF40_04405 [Deltaproteobacteria bacterium]|nr:hypothetical protein [Deltaproteobacteria bacterium]
MKKFLFIILLMVLAFVSAVILLGVAWYFQWPAWVALLGPVVFLVIPLFWWLLTLGFQAIARRKFSKAVVSAEKVVDREALSASILEQDWDRGLLSLRSVRPKKGRDLRHDADWFLFLEPTRKGKESYLQSSGTVADFLDMGSSGDTRRAGAGFNWYLSGDSVLLEPQGFLSISEPPMPLTGAASGVGLPKGPGSKGPQELRPGVAPVGGPPPPEAALPLQSGSQAAAQPHPTLPRERDILQESQDWEAFLKLLAKTGRKKALNGIVLTIPGELLLREREAELLDLSVRTRKLLDRLVKETDNQAPCYIMLTGLAPFRGLPEAVSRLEGKGPVGLLLDKGEEGAIPARLSAELGDVFKNGLLDELGGPPDALSPLLMAPRSLRRLERPLTVYLGGLSIESPFTPPPRVRGVFLDAGGARPQPQDPNAPAEDNLAYSGFLKGVLPANADLSQRLNLPGSTRQKRIVLICAAFYLLALAVGLLFYKNVVYHRDISSVSQGFREGERAFYDPEASGQDSVFQANALSYLLSELEAEKGRHLIRGVGPDRANTFIDDVETDFQKSFERALKQLIMALGQQLKEVPDQNSVEYAITLRQILWLLSVFNKKVKGEDYARLDASFPLLPASFHGPTEQYWETGFCQLLMEYLKRGETDRLGYVPLTELTHSLELAVGMNEDNGMNWLTSWASNLPELRGIKVSDFWDQFGSPDTMRDIIPKGAVTEVPGVYTLKGRAAIMDALAELREVYKSDSAVFAQHFQDYQANYDSAYLATWGGFYASFVKVADNVLRYEGIEGLYAERRRGGHGPYGRFLSTLAANLKPFLSERQSDLFLNNVELDMAVGVWNRARVGLLNAREMPTRKRLGTYGQVIDSLKGSIQDVYYRTEFVERVYQAEMAISKYNTAEGDIVTLLYEHPDQAMRLAAIFFAGGAMLPSPAMDPTTGGKDPMGMPGPGRDPALAPEVDILRAGGAFGTAEEALSEYAQNIYRNPDGTPAEDLFIALAGNTLKNLRSFLAQTSARTLNASWESDVYMPTHFLPPDEAAERLFGPDGLIMKFVEGPAAPFIENRGMAGYAPRKWGTETFPVTRDFLAMASMASSENLRQPFLDSYPVTLTLTGAVVDQGAKEKPERTTLYMKSGADVTTIVSYNYPVTQSFSWKPLEKGETGIEISFPSLSLFVHYDTEQGFPTFLNDIAASGFSFTPADFPDHKEQLEAMGITRIRVLVQADGSYPVISFLSLSQATIPKSIILGGG